MCTELISNGAASVRCDGRILAPAGDTSAPWESGVMGILAVLVMRQTGGGNTGHWVMEILAVLVMGRLAAVS